MKPINIYTINFRKLLILICTYRFLVFKSNLSGLFKFTDLIKILFFSL